MPARVPYFVQVLILFGFLSITTLAVGQSAKPFEDATLSASYDCPEEPNEAQDSVINMPPLEVPLADYIATTQDGHGPGAVVTDLTGDGYPDLYLPSRRRNNTWR